MKFQLAVIAFIALPVTASAQTATLPNPFGAPQYNWATTTDGQPWGSTAAIEIGPHNEIWAIGRCGGNSCEGSDAAPIRQIDPTTGKTIKAIGAGLFIFPHGLGIDRSGNLWVTDELASKDGTRGQQVVELSPDGKVLMRLGTAGAAGGGPDHFNQPSDVVVAPNGDIFVADGHSGTAPDITPDFITRIIHFSKDGKFIKAWGKLGSGPGEFRSAHALAMDSKGRIFLADRGNSRLQIFDTDGKLLAEWKQFGRPSGLYIDKKDNLFVINSDSTEASHPGFRRGIWSGSAATGQVTGFTPDDHAGEGILVGPDGTAYGAVNAPPHGITRYAKH